MVDLKLLRQTFADKGLKMSHIAEQMGISQALFSAKMTGRTRVCCDDAYLIKKYANLSQKEFMSIFFADNVDEKGTEVDA